MKIKVIICFFNFSVICYYIKAKEEIQKRTWIREIQKHKKLPGRNKKYIFGVLPIRKDFKNFVFFGSVHFRKFLAQTFEISRKILQH